MCLHKDYMQVGLYHLGDGTLDGFVSRTRLYPYSNIHRETLAATNALQIHGGMNYKKSFLTSVKRSITQMAVQVHLERRSSSFLLFAPTFVERSSL
jgi:hypothetical protein